MMALAIILIIGYSLPYLVLRENGHYLIHDNLDSVFVWYKVLIESGHIFSGNDTPIEAFMNGVPRGSFPSELNLTLWVYYLLGPLNSYIFERLLFSFVGFWGMYLLLKRHIISGENNALIQIGVAVTFGLLPYWPGAGLTVAGLPMVMYAFLNIRAQNQGYFDWLILFIYPFYSSLILGGIFLLILLGLFFVYDFLINKKLNARFFMAVGMLAGLYLLSHYRLLINFVIDSKYISHRVEFDIESKGFGDCISQVFQIFVLGHFHAQSLQRWIILPTVFIVIFLIWLYKLVSSASHLTYVDGKRTKNRLPSLFRYFAKKHIQPVVHKLSQIIFLPGEVYHKREIVNGVGERLRSHNPMFKIFWHVFVFIFFSSVIYGFIEWSQIAWLKKAVFQYFPIQIQRFYCLHPFLWAILFAITLTVIRDKIRLGEYIALVLLIVQVLYTLGYHEFIRNSDKPTIKEFFAESQFEEIRKFINKPLEDYKVISIGIHPSISQWNGFYTLDGYAVDYPLSYKHKFRGIIEGELEKNEKLKQYFDDWGSRAYIFLGDDIGYLKQKGDGYLIPKLDLNVALLKNMNCNYIFSAVKIDGVKNPDYKLLNIFTNHSSAWDIYLYEII